MENLIKLNNFYKKTEVVNLSDLSLNKVSLFTEPNGLFIKKNRKGKEMDKLRVVKIQNLSSLKVTINEMKRKTK